MILNQNYYSLSVLSIHELIYLFISQLIFRDYIVSTVVYTNCMAYCLDCTTYPLTSDDFTILKSSTVVERSQDHHFLNDIASKYVSA